MVTVSFSSSTNNSDSLSSSIYNATKSCLLKHVEVNMEADCVHGQGRPCMITFMLDISMLAPKEVVSSINTTQCRADLLVWLLGKNPTAIAKNLSCSCE